VASQIIQTRTQKVWISEDGILHFEILPGSTVGLEDAVESIQAGALLCRGVKRPTLIDIRNIRAIQHEARQYYAGPETANVEKAAALLIGSFIGRVIGNFFLGLNKPLTPTRLFTSEEEAVQWLKEFL
jgi:hypothetical protein